MSTDVVPIPLREQSATFASGFSFTAFADQSERYADLLHSRYREARLAPAEQAFFATYPDTLHFLALVAADTPDTIAVLPVLARIVEASLRFDLRIVPDDDVLRPDFAAMLGEAAAGSENDDLELPLLFLLDEDWQLQEQWGPHPQAAAAYVDGWLQRHPEYETLAEDETPAAQEQYAALSYQLVHEMRLWYNSALGAACVAELHALLNGLQAEQGEEDAGDVRRRDEDAQAEDTTNG